MNSGKKGGNAGKKERHAERKNVMLSEAEASRPQQ
jgi:hypothetical protein